jgi:hypothetical protein
VKRLALGVSESGARQTVEWDDRAPAPKEFYHAGRVYRVVMTASVEHVDLAAEWKSAAGSRMREKSILSA